MAVVHSKSSQCNCYNNYYYSYNVMHAWIERWCKKRSRASEGRERSEDTPFSMKSVRDFILISTYTPLLINNCMVVILDGLHHQLLYTAQHTALLQYIVCLKFVITNTIILWWMIMSSLSSTKKSNSIHVHAVTCRSRLGGQPLQKGLARQTSDMIVEAENSSYQHDYIVSFVYIVK